MAIAAHLLDCGPKGGMAEYILTRFAEVASGRTKAIPASTITPMPLLQY